MTRPAILKRFPSWRAPRASGPVIPPGSAAEYPELADDIAVLEREVTPPFQRSDLAALRHQNRFRRQQVVVLLGSALLTGFGGLQAVFPDERWPGLVLTILGIALGTAGQVISEEHVLSEFLTQRVKAEHLRALHFAYLSRTGRFAAPERLRVLRRAVLSVEAGREPS